MRLERATVVRTALELLDQVGLDGLSLRRLAASLGVQAPALYWYFSGKQDLLDAMAQAMLDQQPWPARPAAGQPWDEWLAERARAHRRAMLAHRDGARIHAGTRPTDDHRSEVGALMRDFEAVGFSPLEAISGVLAISHYTVGSAIEQQAAGPGPRAGPTYDFDATYEHGLLLLLDGMRASLLRKRSAATSEP
jgi:TetR/AcrR family tetracycline transcriptional repressor